jgi:hypothetical protein
MARHRSLGNALLTPEKMAFIKGEAQNPAEPIDESRLSAKSNAVIAPVVEHTPAASVAERSPRQANVSRRSSYPASELVPRGTPPPAAGEYLVAVTTRLQAGTADALRRAHLEQKLNRREPATQQEIIELAVQEWLRANLFLG